MRYDAFISYRRSDGAAVAHWLRRELERFRAPRALRDRFDRRLKIFLDIAYERGASDFYEQSIKPALLASRHLVVVATPDAVRNRADDWVAREVADFAAGPNGGNIIVVRGAGAFDDPLPADLKTRFPNIEIVDLRGAGRFWRLNPTRAVRLASEKLKLVAPLLDIPFGDMPLLRQEEERQAQVRIGSAIGATLGVTVAVSGLSIFALESRYQTIRSLEDSLFATGSMVLLSAGLPQDQDAAADRTRRLLVNQGCDLLDKLSIGASRQPQIGELVTCRLERAGSRERLSEQLEARAQYHEAIALAGDRYGRTERSDAADKLIEARQAYAEYLLRQQDQAAAEAEFGLLRDDARRLGAAHRNRSEFARAEGEALGQLGDLLLQRGDRTGAGDSFDQAAVAVRRAATIDGDRVTPETVKWLARLHRRAGEQHMNDDPAGAIERFNLALEACRLIAVERTTPAFDFEAARAQALIAVLEKRHGDGATAEASRGAMLLIIERILAAKDAPADLKQKAAGLLTWVEAQWSTN